jgi:alpha-L-rhamnosidase
MWLLLLLLSVLLAFAQPPPRLIPAPTFEEPYPPLQGGSFSGAPIPWHPDPLGTYVWGPSVNASVLQIFALLPERVSLTPGTAPSSFAGVDSLLTPTPAVTVQGPGGLQFDFGINSAAWLEFESPDLTPSDAALIQLSVSEYNEYEITNLGPKVGPPKPHPRGDGTTMYRLEIPHSDGSGLFEGVRFAWLRVNATPSSPWTISALRIVCQIKPTNWGGAFAAAGNDDLSKIWYLGAYTVKVNLLSDQFGSILIYRGDRFSWTGDAHIAQATAMAALGNFDFVKQNLRFTQNNCNGIESYCMYFVLSVCDYFSATNDTALMHELAPSVTPKLEHAKTIWGKGPLGFYGACGRLGEGTTGSARCPTGTRCALTHTRSHTHTHTHTHTHAHMRIHKNRLG